MNQAVLDFAKSKVYDNQSIDHDYFKDVIYDINNEVIQNIINAIDEMYDADGFIVENVDRFIAEIFEYPEDFSSVNEVIKQAILDNEIENESQFQEVIASNDLDINLLIENGLAYVDNNVYSRRHYILRYQFDIDAYNDYLKELEEDELMEE
ncbi:hypothetical protein [Staphylococcus caprae]|uniref:hypothetical protein n=1 Tax=Staphylococcus caprae TaxID=29380 RepID=UPI0014519692|nr:hypothetical protein [Staphylococcus caprae]QJE26685.1 hypothetical protein HHJ99_13015 [Staphylococcus caprae]